MEDIPEFLRNFKLGDAIFKKGARDIEEVIEKSTNKFHNQAPAIAIYGSDKLIITNARFHKKNATNKTEDFQKVLFEKIENDGSLKVYKNIPILKSKEGKGGDCVVLGSLDNHDEFEKNIIIFNEIYNGNLNISTSAFDIAEPPERVKTTTSRIIRDASIVKDVKNTFVDFDKGTRPENFRTPDYWYVLDGKGKAYPAKAIWSLATKQKLKDFNTTDARNGLAKLEYSLVDIRTQANEDDFEKAVIDSIKGTAESRQRRLKSSVRKPEVFYKLTKTYKRNHDVVAEVLERAGGICDICNNPSPFIRKKGKMAGEPYLEVHHKIQLAHGGEDTVENALALCPNCHREAHFG